MLIKLPSGNKPDNDKLLLDQGFIVLDNESKGIRVHDGSTVGGFESIGIYEPPPPSEFLGEVPVSELINGTDLAALVGLSAGTAINDNEPWLKFYDEVDQKTKFIAKKPHRYDLSWDHLNAAGIVYGKQITIGDNQYVCRLIKSSLTDPYEILNTYDPEPTHGSEWNRLMYPICAPTGNSTYDIITDPTSPGLGAWAQYNQESDLILLNASGNGNRSWCQETNSLNASNRVIRGINGVTRDRPATQTVLGNNYGWRPLLELVE